MKILMKGTGIHSRENKADKGMLKQYWASLDWFFPSLSAKTNLHWTATVADKLALERVYRILDSVRDSKAWLMVFDFQCCFQIQVLDWSRHASCGGLGFCQLFPHLGQHSEQNSNNIQWSTEEKLINLVRFHASLSIWARKLLIYTERLAVS